MAYHNEVRPGDTFAPTASMHNDTARMLNSINGFSSKTGKGNKLSATVLKVYNPTDVDFAPGTPVNFDNDQAIVADSVPIKSYSDEQAPWGVLKDGLQAGCFGSCIVSGPVTISLSGEGKYAVPSVSGFELADDAPEGNSALVLYKNTEQAVICLGAGGGGGASDFPEVATIIGSSYNFNYLIEIGEKKKRAFCIIPLKHYNLPFEENETILVDPFYCQLIPYYTCYSNGYSIGHSGFLLKYPVKYDILNQFDAYGVCDKNYFDDDVYYSSLGFFVSDAQDTAFYWKYGWFSGDRKLNFNRFLPVVYVKKDGYSYSYEPSKSTPSLYGDFPIWYQNNGSGVLFALDATHMVSTNDIVITDSNNYIDLVSGEEYNNTSYFLLDRGNTWNKPSLDAIQEGDLTFVWDFEGKRLEKYYNKYGWKEYEFEDESVVGIYVDHENKETYLVGFKVYQLKKQNGEVYDLILSTRTDKFFNRLNSSSNGNKVFATRRVVFKSNLNNKYIDYYKEDFIVVGNPKQKIKVEKNDNWLDKAKYTYIDESDEENVYTYEMQLKGVVSSCNDSFSKQKVYIGRVPLW